MKRNKADVKSLGKIGIDCYDFDFQFEKNIYCHLCCIPIKRREFDNLDDTLKFDSYRQWKRYICCKYQNYSKEQLMEFSRYLNLKIRNIKPNREYLNIMLPCLITIAISIMFERLIDSNILERAFWSNLFMIICLTILFIFFMFSIVKNTIVPIVENNVDANMLKDYKEIIDEIIINNLE